MAPGERGEQVEPEPQQEVDLLVDDVEAEHAQAVELLLAGGRAHAVERAAGSKEKGMKQGSCRKRVQMLFLIDKFIQFWSFPF